MLAVRVIPCLDCAGGRVVKGVKFENLRDAGDPVERALAYEEQGADELVLLDVSATPEERGHRVETVRAVRRGLAIPLTVGGGVRSAEDGARLLESGADKIGINTAAMQDPRLVTTLASRFGSQCVVLAIDAARLPNYAAEAGWEVVVESGRKRTGRPALEWAREVCDRGAGEILLTSVDRDGTRSGYDLDLISAVAAAVPVPVVASGGADNPAHLLEAVGAGADAVLAASIFHKGHYTVGEVKAFLRAGGLEVRL